MAHRRVIVVGPDEERVGDEAIAALALCEDVFVRDGKLVRVVDALETDGVVRVEPIPTPRLREVLSRCARWVERADEGPEHRAVCVPGHVVRAVAARGSWPGMRPLRAVVTRPILRPDGSVLAEPGYDPSTHVYLAVRRSAGTIPTQPSDAAGALNRLRIVAAGLSITDDYFVAAWIAVVATSLARHAFSGPSPLFVFLRDEGANDAALPTITALSTQAEAPARVAAIDLAQRPARVLASLRGDDPFVAIDQFHALDAATQLRVCDVLLAERAAQRFTWITAVSRRVLDPEVAARVVAVGRREKMHSVPSQRTPRLGVDRAKMAALVLALLAAHPVETGEDELDDPTLHAWSARVEDALLAAGLPRILDVQPIDVVSHEPAAIVMRTIENLSVARDAAVTVRDLLNALDDDVRGALEALDPGVLQGPRAPHRLGHLLLRISRSPVDGRRLSLVGSGSQGNRWMVRDAG